MVLLLVPLLLLLLSLVRILASSQAADVPVREVRRSCEIDWGGVSGDDSGSVGDGRCGGDRDDDSGGDRIDRSGCDCGVVCVGRGVCMG